MRFSIVPAKHEQYCYGRTVKILIESGWKILDEFLNYKLPAFYLSEDSASKYCERLNSARMSEPNFLKKGVKRGNSQNG